MSAKWFVQDPRRSPPRPPNPPDLRQAPSGGRRNGDLATLSLRELRRRARRMDIAGRSRMDREQLVQAIRRRLC
ncbi:MAG: hypothetical protein ACFCBW_12385 [Candidatus Competibacterales bacterium]